MSEFMGTVKGVEMTREELIYEVCPYKSMIDCHSEEPYTHFKCKDCSNLMNKWLDEYDKHVIEQYKLSTNIIDTIREIHDNVAQEMYCKGIDDLCNEISTYRMYDEYGNVIDLLEIVKRFKERE